MESLDPMEYRSPGPTERLDRMGRMEPRLRQKVSMGDLEVTGGTPLVLMDFLDRLETIAVRRREGEEGLVELAGPALGGVEGSAETAVMGITTPRRSSTRVQVEMGEQGVLVGTE